MSVPLDLKGEYGDWTAVLRKGPAFPELDTIQTWRRRPTSTYNAMRPQIATTLPQTTPLWIVATSPVNSFALKLHTPWKVD